MNNDSFSAPMFPSRISALYSLLDIQQKKLFNKVFMFLWDYVRKKVYSSQGVLYSYWIVDDLRKSYDLDTSELSAIAFIYQITDGGKGIIHSKMVYNGMPLHGLSLGSKLNVLNRIKRKGFIKRSTRDTSAPYLQRSISSRPEFIQLTPYGVGVVKDIEKRINTLIMQSSLNDIIGVKT